MPGVYELKGCLGFFPDSTWASDSLTLVKESFYESTGIKETDQVMLSLFDSQEWLKISSHSNIPCEQIQFGCSPNPFNAEAALQFSLPGSGQTNLTVYDISGRAVATLLDRTMEAGWHSMNFNAEHLASGIYLAVLDSGKEKLTQRLLLVK
jgi:hypothetical protein